MRLNAARDIPLVRDIALSHLLSRDHTIALGYFASVGRANARLVQLVRSGYLRRLLTPFFGQSLYMAGSKAHELVGERIRPLLLSRKGSPRFIQHAVCVSNARVELLKAAPEASWRFEQQVTTKFRHAGRTLTLRPDGARVWPDRVEAVEIDLGHVTPSKFREKIRTYETFLAVGAHRTLWQCERLSLLVVTTGRLRAKRLASLRSAGSALDMQVVTHDDLSIQYPGGWS